MSASFRSHFRGSAQQGLPSTQRESTQSSRIPTKSSSSNAESKPSKAAEHVSKLAKRTSRTIATAEKAVHGSRSTTAPVSMPVTTPQSQPADANPPSSVPQPRVAYSSTPAPTVSRHNIFFPRPTIRTPPVIPGTSAPTLDGSRTIGLRRKPSNIKDWSDAKRTETPKIDTENITKHKQDDQFEEVDEEPVSGMQLPPARSEAGAEDEDAEARLDVRLRQDIFGENQPVTRDITPPVPHYAQTATPSTRYTDSPFSHAPTPSSASSYSSAVIATTSSTPARMRQQSPTRSRPPVTGRASAKSDGTRLGLPPVRESSTSSSSSTVKPTESRLGWPKRDIPQKPASAPPEKTYSDQSQSSFRGKRIKDQSQSQTQSQTQTQTQPSSTPSVAKPDIHIPPELAHLNVEPPPRPSLNKPYPPLRPSRDGTSSLAGMNAPSLVVQSDLPRLYTTYHKRTPSQETPTSATSPSFKTRFGLSPKASSKQSSPRIDSAISPPPAARTFARGATPDEPVSEASRVVRKDSPAVGPNPSKSPRFGFFSRKPKSDNTKLVEKPKRQPSKGPIAGTGHEGYGRFGVRSRTGSISSAAGAAVRSPSAESTISSQRNRQSMGKKGSVSSKDGSELDDFLRERLSPVVLRGSGSTFSNAASSSEAQLPSVPNSSKNSSLDSIPKPQLLPSAMDSVAGMSPAKQSKYGRRIPSDSSEDDIVARYPALPSQHSTIQPWQQGDRNPVVRASMSMDSYRPSKDSSFDSYDAESSTWTQTDSTLPREDPFGGKEGMWLRSRKIETEPKVPRKWNFLQRAHASPRDKGKAKESPAMDNPTPMAHQSPHRGIAHYAMHDYAEPVGLEDVERILLENETSAEESMSESNAPPKLVPYERRHTGLMPAPPKPEHSDDFDFQAGPKPPRITIRPDSQESPELMRAEKTVPHQAPHVVDIRRSPTTQQSDPWAEQKAMVSDLKPEVQPSHGSVQTPEMPQAPFNTPENPENDSPARQPRLSPIGRIPKVVSKRDRERKLSDNSFSRPFAHTQPKPTVKPPGSLYTQIRELASPIESASLPVSSTSTNSYEKPGEQQTGIDALVPSASKRHESMDLFGRDLFSFPTRLSSDVSYSSSSGNDSIRAVLAQLPQEDDVWNEYNDWLDEVLPGKTIPAAVSLDAPFEPSAALHDSPAMFPTLGLRQPPPLGQLPALPRSQTVPAVLSVPQQVARFMQPSLSPLGTTHMPSEAGDHYGNSDKGALATGTRNSGQSANRSSIPQPARSSIPGPSRPTGSGTTRTSVPGPNRSSLPRSSRSSLPGPSRISLPRSDRSSIPGSVTSSARHSRSSGHSRSASLPEANARNSQSSLTPSARFNRDTQLLDIAEVDGDEQAAAANLRFGALMTSKWLSFGRVLFSPAHNEMRLADEPKVLIIDGLGSDWSYYVALSYPAATIYNLGPAQANGMSDWPGVNQKPPSNHRHINHAAISAAFPFPKGFFTAVVFRFPLVTTDQAYQACVFECKRVLRPGGYLEVAALDLDLMNMGNRARKEIRGLKTRMQHLDSNVSLRNLSDVLVRLIGRRGFEEVQRCIVGVPAAGRIPRSQDISSVSSGGSGKPVWQREDRHSQEFSFADLLEDARASQAGEDKGNDENITKMVAKVGRWWYSTCYEKALLQTDNSIWNDSSLLRECEKQGTSFRLLICYAQKPAQTRRRTVSV